jgi:transcription elongation factor GreA
MDKTITYLTGMRVKELKEELDYLKVERQPEVAKLIKDARSLGSIEENEVYDDYVEQQSIIESRIREIENMLSTATVIKASKKSTVGLGCKVIVEVEGRKDSFIIVGVEEAAPHKGKISHESPLGQSLIGCSVGQEVLIETEVYSTMYKILTIENA